MTFQFLCPQGHLLQGEEAHMGMQCQCPQCGTAFIIPTIERTASGGPMANTGSQPAQTDFDLAPLDEPDEVMQAPFQSRARHQDPGPTGLEGFAAGGLESQDVAASEAFEGIGDISDEVTETLLHIPCPNGHVLDVPLDMIGARAMCPHCRAEFRLRREKSHEYLREQEILDAKRAQFWFKLAIIAAGVVVVVLLVMILATSLT